MSWRPRSRRPDARRPPARVGGALERVLDELGLDVEKTRRLDTALRAALGPELAPHFELVDLRGKVAELRADASVWSQELALHKSAVLAALRAALGPDAPTELRLRVR
jgi:predicted nucleic acid-binding Zn ribbon protein